MRELIENVAFGLGGAFVGGAAVAAYAKATGQRIVWRRRAVFRWAIGLGRACSQH